MNGSRALSKLFPSMSFKVVSIPVLIVFFFLVGGCGFLQGKPGAGDEKSGGFFSWFRPAIQEDSGDEGQMTRQAMDYFERGRYSLAEELFQKIRDRYPFSPYATLAELRLADVKYYDGLYEEAIPLYQEFEKLHPTNEAIPYVIFQQGSCFYSLMDTPDRDQTASRKVIEIGERLLKRYPESPYGFQAKRMIAEARERLALHEVFVARWYLRTGRTEQAKERLETVMDLYPETRASLEARGLLRTGGDGALSSTDEVSKSPPSLWRRMIPYL